MVLIIPTKKRRKYASLSLWVFQFTKFRYRTAFYRARRSIGNRAQVKLGLTKQQHDILKARNDYIKSIGHTAKFCYADINYQANIKWVDNYEDFF